MIEKDLALIGCGYWGKNLARNFYELGSLKVIVENCPKRCQELNQQYPDIDLVEDIQQILDDPTICKVVIATPAITHYELVKKSLEAGKDVFVEKPISLEESQGRELISIQGSSILMVGHILHYHSAIATMKARLKDIGKVLYIESRRMSLGKIRKEENVLWSFAPHDISLALLFMSEKPKGVSCQGTCFLQEGIEDTVQLSLDFGEEKKAFIHVSWASPFKEQKLTLIGTQGAFVFDDTKDWKSKLAYFPKLFEKHSKGINVHKNPCEYIHLEALEPLKEECRHFLHCCKIRKNPLSDAQEGLNGLQVLSSAQKSLSNQGLYIPLNSDNYYVHPSSYVDKSAYIGKGCKIWHFSHIMSKAILKEGCNIGQNVVISPGVHLGKGVKVQNNVSLYSGLYVEDEVFIGPSVVFTNIKNPRSAINRKDQFVATTLKKGATIGANATLVCGVNIGQYSFIGAGALVNKDVKDFALVVGNPAKQIAWVDKKGERLPFPIKGEAADFQSEEGVYQFDGEGIRFSSAMKEGLANEAICYSTC